MSEETRSVRMTWPELQRQQAEARRALVYEALEVAGWNRSEAARLLDWDRGALCRFIRDMGLEVPPSPHDPPRRSRKTRG